MEKIRCCSGNLRIRLDERGKFLPRGILCFRLAQQHAAGEVMHYNLSLLLWRKIHEVSCRVFEHISGAFTGHEAGPIAVIGVAGIIGIRYVEMIIICVIAIIIGSVLTERDLAEDCMSHVDRADILVLPYMRHFVDELIPLYRSFVGIEIYQIAGYESA